MKQTLKMQSGAKVSVDQYKAQKKTKKKSGANEITRSVCSYLTLKKAYVVRVNTQGQWDDKKKIWRKSHTKLGTADIHACINGRFVSIEIKANNDKMRPAQWATKAEVEKAGGIYIIVSSLEDVISFLDKM